MIKYYTIKKKLDGFYGFINLKDIFLNFILNNRMSYYQLITTRIIFFADNITNQ